MWPVRRIKGQGHSYMNAGCRVSTGRPLRQLPYLVSASCWPATACGAPSCADSQVSDSFLAAWRAPGGPFRPLALANIGWPVLMTPRTFALQEDDPQAPSASEYAEHEFGQPVVW